MIFQKEYVLSITSAIGKNDLCMSRILREAWVVEHGCVGGSLAMGKRDIVLLYVFKFLVIVNETKYHGIS